MLREVPSPLLLRKLRLSLVMASSGQEASIGKSVDRFLSGETSIPYKYPHSLNVAMQSSTECFVNRNG